MIKNMLKKFTDPHIAAIMQHLILGVGTALQNYVWVWVGGFAQQFHSLMQC